MLTTRSKYSLVFALVVGAIACAEPAGITVPSDKKQTGASGASSKSSTKEDTSSGGSSSSETESPSKGGATPKTTAKVTPGEGGGSAKTSTPTASGGADNPSTDVTGTGGAAEATTAPTTPAGCETSLKQVTVTATSTQNGASGDTTIVPTEGASIAAADLGVKFCFTISSNLTDKALIISYAAITLKVSPYNVEVTTAKITLEEGSGGESCFLIDVGGVPAAAALTMDSTSSMKITWRFDHTVFGTSVPDPSQSTRFIVVNGSDVAGCGDVALTKS